MPPASTGRKACATARAADSGDLWQAIAMNRTAHDHSSHPDSRRRPAVVTCALLLLVLSLGSVRTWSAPGPRPAERAPQDTAARVARGEYLATSVALCIQCHSPRDAKGNLIETETFRGGAIPVQSPYPGDVWAFSAPSLRGLVGLTDAQVVELLTEGKATGRPAPKRPMPPFRLSQADAEAIVAYLRTR